MVVPALDERCADDDDAPPPLLGFCCVDDSDEGGEDVRDDLSNPD